MDKALRRGLGFWFCFFKTQFYFNNVCNKKVNKNKVQNKRREEILLAALKWFPDACFWQGRKIWYLAT